MKTVFARTPYQGVVQIVLFNRRFYLVGAVGTVIAINASLFLPRRMSLTMMACALPLIFWLASSLIVSHYVYDRSSIYEFNWLSQVIPRTPTAWVNIHCGFDEISHTLVAKFPGANFQTLDIFDPQVMTEPSISIARRIKSFPVHAAAAHYDALPCASGSFEAAFLFFAAHELRRHDQRVLLFKEVARIVMPGGSIILVEHARDLWNFLAFGPGAFHFFSQRVWRSATFEAGLIVHSHRSITPFVHVYSLRKIA